MNQLRLSVFIVILAFTLQVEDVYALKAAKTPTDVYQLVMLLQQQVLTLKNQKKIIESWPVIETPLNIQPRHVLQKSLEVLNKIRRYRIENQLGDISTPNFPTREVTPNEVYQMVDRLVDELVIITGVSRELLQLRPSETLMIPADVYRELWEVSRVMDTLLGQRDIRDTEVFALSEFVVEQVKFLRLTQNLPLNIAKPEKPKGKHANHALQATYQLIEKLADLQRKLWLQPVKSKVVPHRVIRSEEVYDALLFVVAEIEHVKFRLGVERKISIPANQSPKDINRIIQNIHWATEMLPKFDDPDSLQQFEKNSLIKRSDHVYAITASTLKKLEEYRFLRGIKTDIPEIPVQVNLSPRHVFQKTLENIVKVNQLRKVIGIGSISLPRHPLRNITPTEVYDLVLRLDAELDVIYESGNLPVNLKPVIDKQRFRTKNSSHVFSNMWRISFLLDTLINEKDNSPRLIIQHLNDAMNEVRILLGIKHVDVDSENLQLGSHVTVVDLFLQSHKLITLINQIKHSAGILEEALPEPPEPKAEITLTDVHYKVKIFLAELINLKAVLENETEVHSIQVTSTPSLKDIYIKMIMLEKNIKALLEG